MKKSVLLSIIGVLLVIGVGITFAYFSSGVEVSGSGSTVELQPGDVLWKTGHVEMYIGNGLRVGAHTDQVPAPDQISIENYSPGYFTKVYRFITN